MKYLSIMSKKTKIKCLGVIVLALASAFLASVWPVKLGGIYTSVTEGRISTVAEGAQMVLAFGIIYLSAECISIIRRVVIDCIIATHESEVREHSVEKLLKMPVSYYSESLSGEKTAQLNQGVAGFSQLIKIICNDIVTTVLTAVCTIYQVFANAPLVIVLIMLGYLAVTVIISLFQIRSQNGIRESIVTQKNSLVGQICQSIGNLELIRGMNAEKYEKNRLLPSILNIGSTERKHHHYMGAFDCLKQFFKVAFQVAVILVSIFLVSKGRMSVGSVITVCLLFQQLIKPIDEVYRFMDETASSLIKSKTLVDVFSHRNDEIFDIKRSNLSVEKDSSILFSNVTITNPEKSKNLAHYENLVIPCNSIVGLKGASGCGKTTMIRCLTRYYSYKNGEVFLFGKNLKDYSQDELSEMLYYTPQNTFFVAGSIRENLKYGIEKHIGDEVLIDALNKACLIGDYKGAIENPSANILDYPVSEGGSNLSGGQRQRLALARAFLREPKLYVFDESTANLDKNTSETVLSNIERHANSIGAGIIYIAHDADVIKRCKKVIEVVNKLIDRVNNKAA